MEPKVIINKIAPQTVELFDPSGNSLGFVNECEMNDVKIQIVKHSLKGYYFRFNGEEITISENGEFEHWPKGLFDLQLSQFSEMINLRKK